MKLTDTQAAILTAAANGTDGNIEPPRPTPLGGARAQVVKSLHTRRIIDDVGDRHVLTDADYVAVGQRWSIPYGAQNADAPDVLQNLDGIPRTICPGAKLADIIDAMQQPRGRS